MLGVVLAACLYPAGTQVLERTSRAFETTQIEKESDRVAMAISAQALRLKFFARDYGTWDSAMNFIAGTEPDFIEENVYRESVVNIGANFAIILDANRRVVYAGELQADPAAAPDEKLLSPMVMPQVQALVSAAVLEHTRAKLDALSEYVWLDGECYILGISAITDSDVSVFGGWWIFGRRMDAQFRQTLSEQLKAKFFLAPIDTQAGAAPLTNIESPEALAPQPNTAAGLTHVKIFDASFSSSRTLSNDFAQARLSVRTQGPRPLAAQRAQAQRLLLAAVVLTVLTSMLLTYAILHFLVIKRVRALSLWARASLESIAELSEESAGSAQHFDEIECLRQDFSALTLELQRLTDLWKVEAWKDWLTQVGNRAKLMHDLSGANTVECALLLLDLDNFKPVNDVLGHLAGDALLSDVARRIESHLPTQASVYRLGGDEFAVFWNIGATRAGVDALAEQLLEALRITQASVSVTASIGIVMPEPSTQCPAELLMRAADIALYAAKQAGRDQYRYFDAT